MLRLALASLALASAAGCPGSESWIHAKAEVDVEILGASCRSVQKEIRSRVALEKGWKDPHNGGTYRIIADSAGAMELERRTGDGKYTDRMDLAFADEGGCAIRACSESQGTSIKDFSTNFCNLHVLWCGSADNCPIVDQDFEYREHRVDVSFGAGKDKSACVTANVDHAAAA